MNSGPHQESELELDWSPRIRRIDNIEREHLKYVRLLIKAKRTEEASEELLGILRRNDKSVRAHLMLGAIHQDEGRLAEARARFRTAVETDPMESQAHLRLGTCCLKMNDPLQARESLTAALHLDPKLVAGRVALAQALARLGEVDTAILHVEEVLRQDPQMASARMVLAKLLNRQGRPKDAIAELGDFVRANPGNTRAAVGLAQLQDQQGETGQAIALLEAAAAARPDDADIWSRLGRMRMAVKDFAGAEQAYTAFARLQPQDRLAALRLVGALIPQGKFGQARDLLKQVPRHGRLASPVHQCYGDIYAAENRNEEAVQSYRAAILHCEGGEQALRDIEAALSAATDSREIIARLKSVLARLRDSARAGLAAQRRGGG